MLAKRVVERLGDRVRYEDHDFGSSPLADSLGVKQYPAVFIDRVLVATPRDFYDWGSGQPGRYTPWSEAESRQRFERDLERMIALRLRDERLEARPLDEPAAADLRLPALQPSDLDGRAVDTAALGGQPLVVVFWATWCPPCHAMLDWLLALPSSRRLRVLAIAVESEAEAVRAATAELPAAGVDVVLGDHRTIDAFGGVMAVPTVLLFAADGARGPVFYGAPPDLHQRVEQALDQWQPAAAAGGR